MEIHVRQVLTYVKLTGLPVGLLINFNVPKLTDGVRRVVNPVRTGVVAAGRQAPACGRR